MTTSQKHVLPDDKTPLNHEEPLPKLVSSYITTDAAFNRNHGEIVYLDAATHRVTVDGEVTTPLNLSIASLKNEFEQHEVICALQCAGNRRDTMRRRWKDLRGLNWCDGAIMNCRWRGPRLRDVLIKAGVSPDADTSGLHAVFSCYQTLCEDDDHFGGSIELWRAMSVDAEVILALQMNGEDLKPSYGYPVRVVVPGVAGARWVKWLDRISVRHEESESFYQRHDYKALPSEVATWEESEPYWAKVPAFQDTPVNSIIGVPVPETTVLLDESGCFDVRGIAVPAGDHGPITRVEVSVDEGESWTDASFEYPEKSSKWSWITWSAKVKVPPEVRGKKVTVFSRATDKGGNTQPRKSPWNIRGIGYNGYGEARDVLIS